MLTKLLAEGAKPPQAQPLPPDVVPSQSDSIFGRVPLPPGIDQWGGLASGGLVGFLNAILRLMIVVGGLWVLINIIIAGYQFLGAGGKPENVQAAWAKIWESLIGLLFIAGAFVLAAIFGQVIFGDPTAIISPRLVVPQ